MRNKKFVIGVFVALGLLILYDVLFFMKKKAGADVVAPTTQSEEAAKRDGAVEAPRHVSKVVPDASEVPTVVRVEPPSMQGDFSRDPFLLPIEEREGKSLKQIEADAEALARQQMKKEDPEVLKKLRELHLKGVFCSASAAGGSGARRLALIDGELVSEGAVLSAVGATVVRITATEVELQAGEIHHVLELSPLSPLGFQVK
ncbi:MAG: hypothetical protein HYR85_07290 [Planctomycetes bacterium]|nr:hypothetical protein [Planctomycetota bacterium]MBI3847560.1 hypothetical protein [Planctomycetota bacterium]